MSYTSTGKKTLKFKFEIAAPGKELARTSKLRHTASLESEL
jgi:hypothetical protein